MDINVLKEEMLVCSMQKRDCVFNHKQADKLLTYICKLELTLGNRELQIKRLKRKQVSHV